MTRVLITGGAGFVGGSLARSFLRDGSEVVLFDNLRRRGSEWNLGELLRAGAKFVHGDVRIPADLESLDGNFDVLIEASAEPSVHAGIGGSPRYVIDTNLGGAANCLEFARQRCGGLVFLSTSRVYSIEALRALPLMERDTRFDLELAGITEEFSTRGSRSYYGASKLAAELLSTSRVYSIEALRALPLMERDTRFDLELAGITEEFSTRGSRSYYGASKLAAELLCEEYAAHGGVKVIVNRCGVIAGSGQFGRSDQGVFTLWVARHIFGRPLTYTGFGGTGKQVRDLLHPDDLYDLIARQLQSLDAVSGETFNVGGGRQGSVSMQELTALCREATGSTVPVTPVDTTASVDVPWYITDHAKVTRRFGWTPRRDPESIVRDIAAWIGDNSNTLRDLIH